MIPDRSRENLLAQRIQRRRFLGFSSSLLASLHCTRLLAGDDKAESTVRLGLIADLHQDLVPDAAERLDTFLEHSSQHRPHALIQLGDFATPIAKNKTVIDRFNAVAIPKFHVIGNHDTDGGLKVAQVVDSWGMRNRYYSEVIEGIKLIVLDANDKPANHRGGYPAHIAEEQLEWLSGELKHTGPMLILSHQPLAGPAAIDNAAAVQKLLSAAADRILLAINGHTHIDEFLEVGGVHYWHVNSASYYWVGGNYKHESLSKELHAKYPAMSSTCPYREALFAFLEIDLERGLLTLSGRESTWVGPSPSQLGVADNPDLQNDKQITPSIRSRNMERAI